MHLGLATILNMTILFHPNHNTTTYLIKDIIDKNFPQHLIVNYIRDECNLSYFIDEVLLNRRTYINRPSSDYLPHLDLTNGKKIKSNLVSTGNYSYLIQLFNRRSSDQFNFVAHGLVLIFFEGTPGDFSESSFTLATGIHGIRIILIEGIFTSKINVKYINERRIIAQWNNVDGFTFRSTKKLYWLPNFIPKTYFTISSFHCPPFMYANKTHVYDGIEYLIIKHVGKNWPLKFLIHRGSNGSLYSHSKNFLKNGESNIAVCSQWQISLSGKLELYDISKPYSQTCVTFLVPKPHPLPVSSFVFQPFHALLWLTLIVIVITVACSLHITSLFYNFWGEIKFCSDLFTSIEYSIRILILEGIPLPPPQKCRALLIVLHIWILCSLLLSTAYSAGIASILTSDRYTKKVSEVRDMFDNGIYWGAQDGSMKKLFSAETEVEKRLSQIFFLDETIEMQNRRIREDESGVLVKRLSINSKYVTDTENLDEYGQTHLKVLSDCAGEYAIVLVFQKNSPFTLIFDKQILKLNEHGILIYWFKQITRKYKISYMSNFFTNAVTNVTNAHKPLNMQKLQGAFYLWLLIIIFALITFLYENLKIKIK